MDVEFNEPPALTRKAGPTASSGLSQLVINVGLAKTPKGAQLVLLIAVVFLLLLTGFLFAGASKQPPAPTPAQVVL